MSDYIRKADAIDVERLLISKRTIALTAGQRWTQRERSE